MWISRSWPRLDSEGSWTVRCLEIDAVAPELGLDKMGLSSVCRFSRYILVSSRLFLAYAPSYTDRIPVAGSDTPPHW